jgi:hypothetical protein
MLTNQNKPNERKNMKHVGKMKNNSARVVVCYRTLPNDPLHALVVGTQGLPDSHHDSLMNLLESSNGQDANELADILATRKFPDGTNMLGYLHERGHLKRVPTNMVLMTPNTQMAIPLDQINQMIADQKGITLEELAVKEENPENKPARKRKDPEAPETPEQTAARLRSEADALYKKAKELRDQAEAIVPTVKKRSKEAAT